MLAHLDEVIIEASPRFRVRVSAPGARRHVPRSSSSPGGLACCFRVGVGVEVSSAHWRTLTRQSVSNLKISALKSTSQTHRAAAWLRLLLLDTVNVMTSPGLGTENVAIFSCLSVKFVFNIKKHFLTELFESLLLLHELFGLSNYSSAEHQSVYSLVWFTVCNSSLCVLLLLWLLLLSYT